MKKFFVFVFSLLILLPCIAQEYETLEIDQPNELSIQDDVETVVLPVEPVKPVNPVVPNTIIRPIVIKAKGEPNGTISLTDLKVDVKVVGNIATTTLDMIFFNSSNRILEGEFEFPLNEGQTISGYSLEISGRLRKGVVVEKEKGRQVFEDIVRREADPGLVEMTKGNNFKTRIYPFQPSGSRHVQISYEQELLSVNNTETNKIDKKYVLMPLTDNELKNFSFNMNVNSLKSVPETTGNLSFDFSPWNTGYSSSFTKSNFTFNEPIEVIMPDGIEEFGIYTQEEGADTYFYYYAPVEAELADKKAPEKIKAIFDMSASCKYRNIEREIDLLCAYAMNYRAELSVTTFSNTILDTHDFGKDYFVDEVKSYLKSQFYDGGTCLGCLDFNSYDADEIILFTDGISTWQSNTPIKGKIPVTIINSSYSADFGAMKLIARENNGNFINLCTKNNDEALNEMKKEPFRLVQVDYNKDEVSDIYPAAGSIVNSDFSLSGLLKAKNAQITLSFGYGMTVTKKLQVKLTAIREDDKQMPETVIRIWAQKLIEELSVDYDKNKTKITEIAKKYGIVTKDTSLLVLESVRDYIRYGIIPPDEMLDEYNRLTLNNFKPDTLELKGIPREVYTNFEIFKKWWLTTPEEFLKQARNDKKKRNVATPSTQRVASARASAAIEDTVWDDAEIVEDHLGGTYETAAAIDYVTREFAAEGPVDAINNPASEASVTIKAWSPDAEYLAVLKRTSSSKMYQKYNEIKDDYESSPSFFMDVSDYFMKEGLREQAIRILSNLSELKLENTDILRALGNKLVEYGLNKEAVNIFEQLVVLRPEIPQFFRDLGLAYNSIGEYQKAVNALYHVASNKWDARFAEIQQICLNDMNAIIALNSKKIDTTLIDRKLMENFPVDIRIVLTWNTDDCDVDLWVTDPNNEKCFYGHKQTLIGGHNTRDFTMGYGPEEFCLKQAVAGKYKIQADYYGTHSQKILQPVVVQAEVYINFGKPNQTKQILTLQLETVKGNYTIGEIDFK